MLTERWIDYFYGEVKNAKRMSKDVDTKVGAVIFDEFNKVPISSGWNDLPRRVTHNEERNSRPLKYKLTSHAEISAIANAARMGRSTNLMCIMVSMYPCSLCAAALINAGIIVVYSPPPDFSHEKYGEDFKLSAMMFHEAGVHVVEIPLDIREES